MSVTLSSALSAFALVFRQALALGFGELFELLFAHRIVHALGGALQRAFPAFAALDREGSPGRFLLGFRGGGHGRLLGSTIRRENAPAARPVPSAGGDAQAEPLHQPAGGEVGPAG